MSKHNNRKTQSLIGLALAVIIIPSHVQPSMSVRAMIAIAAGFPVGGPVLKKFKPSPTAVLKDFKTFLEKAKSSEIELANKATKILDSLKIKDDALQTYATDTAKSEFLGKHKDYKFDSDKEGKPTVKIGEAEATDFDKWIEDVKVALAELEDAATPAATAMTAANLTAAVTAMAASGGLGGAAGLPTGTTVADVARVQRFNQRNAALTRLQASGLISAAPTAAGTLKNDADNKKKVEAAGELVKSIDETFKGWKEDLQDKYNKRGLVLELSGEYDLFNKADADVVTKYAKLLGDNTSEEFNTERTKALVEDKAFAINAIDEQTGFEVPNFWRRLALIAEGEVIWFMDWFSVGPKVGVSGDLFKLVSKDNPDISTANQFSVNAGLTMGFTKWFSVDVLLSLMRCSLTKEKTSASTEQGKALEELTKLHSSFKNSLSGILDDSDEGKSWSKAISGLDLQKSLEARYDGINGWAWGATLRGSFNLWITEFLAAKVGLEWNIPFTDISGTDAAGDKVSFSPAQKVSPYVGLVLAII